MHNNFSHFIISVGLDPYLTTVAAWYGVGSRWKEFFEWVQHHQQLSAMDAFKQFGNHLGRVTTYRALSLDNNGLETIQNNDSIWPSGR